MTITIEELAIQDSWTWRVTWLSDQENALSYVYVNGELFASGRLFEAIIPAQGGEQPVIAIFDDGDGVPGVEFPSRWMLQWETVAGVEYYKVQEYVDSAWVDRAHVYDRGQPNFHWFTRVLEDVTAHQFKIVPVGVDANVGTGRELQSIMVRTPDVPDYSVAYSNGTHKITVTII